MASRRYTKIRPLQRRSVPSSGMKRHPGASRPSFAKSNTRRRSRARGTRRNKRATGNGTNAPPRRVRNLPQNPNPIYPITRALRRVLTLDSSTIDGAVASNIQLTFAPSATDYRFDGVSIYNTALPSVTEFSNLFDQWRLKGVTIRCDFASGYSNSATTPVIMPNIYYVSDYDDPQDCTINDMLQYPQCQVHNFYRNGYEPLQVSMSPKPLRDVAGSGISTGYGPMPSAPWLRTADMSLPHYGFKMALDWMGKVQTADVQMVLTIWYHLEFTNPK